MPKNFCVFVSMSMILISGWSQPPSDDQKNQSTTRVSGRWYVDFEKSQLPVQRWSIMKDEYVVTVGSNKLTAKFDGAQYAIPEKLSDESHKTIRVERVNTTTVREVDSDAAGKVSETDTLTLDPAGGAAELIERPDRKPQSEHLRRVGGGDGTSIDGEWEYIPNMWVQYDPIENGFHVSSGDGNDFIVKFDGTHTPIKGDPAYDSIRYVRIDDISFYDIKYKGDKVFNVLRTSIAPDGKELRHEILNPNSGSVTTLLSSRRTP